MDRIHHLLRFVWRSFPKREGHVTVALAGHFIRDVKPDFDPGSYGFEEMFQLLQAYPDRYAVSRDDAGKWIYQCMIPEEADEREEVLTQEDIQAREKPRDETGSGTGAPAAAGIHCIHRLLRLACNAYRREDGYVTLAHAVYFFKYIKPDFDPGDYGFETLSQLILDFPYRYEAGRNNTGGFLYKCIDFEEVSRAEEAEIGAADGIDRIHHLLRRARDIYRQTDGYTRMNDAGQFIKRVKPAFDPHTYGFETLSKLVQAYPDRYKVTEIAMGVQLYQCITPEEESRAEDVQPQERGEPRVQEESQGEAGTAGDVESVHSLLRRAAGQREDGYISVAAAEQFIKQVKPEFDPRTYGFETLSQLVQACPDRYEITQNAMGILIYQCIAPEEENKAEDVQPQEAARGETEG